MKLGLYGGSFDPVHSGHVRVARLALERLGLDRLLVLPAAVSPFKTDAAPAGGYDRLALLTAAFAGMGPRVTVDDRELRRGGVSYAIDTVREIGSEHPGAELHFIVGEDSVEGLARWREAEELKRLCTFDVFPRTSESSTEVRRRLACGEPVDGLVPEAVALFLRHGVRMSGDERVTGAVRGGLAMKGGYCPCRLPRTPENMCPCAEFRAQLADASYHGLCHCRLYQKP